MYDLSTFSLKEMTEMGQSLRNAGTGAKNMEEAAGKIIRYIYDYLGDGQSGKNACVLARLFKTHPYKELNKELQEFARVLLGRHSSLLPETPCLTLLGTAGELPEWNTRHKSKGHKSIPLVSEKFVLAFPMISNLVRQLGLEINQVVEPRQDIILDLSKQRYNVFYVLDAVGNPIIPAQESFVVPYGVRSVLGFGGVLPSGSLFAVILFTKVPIHQEVAELFKTLALDIKLALLPFENKVFA